MMKIGGVLMGEADTKRRTQCCESSRIEARHPSTPSELHSKDPLTRIFGYFRYLVSNYQYHPSFLSLEELGVERKVSQMEATRLS